MCFFSLVAIDGAGKSTVLSTLRSVLARLQIVSWKDVEHMTWLHRGDDLLPMGERLIKLGARTRTGLIAYLLAAEYEHAIEPKVREQRPTLVDSYWYKIVAREMVAETSERWLLDFARTLPKPSLVLFLDVDPAIAAERKRRFTPAEVLRSPSDFVPFQRCVRDTIISYLKADGVKVITVDGSRSRSEIAMACVEHIRAHRSACMGIR